MRKAIACIAVGMLGVGMLAACGKDDDSNAASTVPGATQPASSCAASDARGMDASASPDPVVPTPTIDGVVTFAGLTHNHVEGCIDYPQNPPVGGDHASVWQNCAFYAESIVVERGVHSMEHGAVWISYDAELAVDQLDALEQLAGDFVLVSPWNRESLSSPVVASAWGLQLELSDATDPRLEAFVSAYANGPQNREAGAPCHEGGTDETI